MTPVAAPATIGAIRSRTTTTNRQDARAAEAVAAPRRETRTAPVVALARHAQAAVGNRAAARSLSRRLFAEGDFGRFERFVEPATGLDLDVDPITRQVSLTVDADVTSPRSPALAADLIQIVGDPVKDAEIDIGSGQDRVLVGAFPEKRDLTGKKAQRLDMGDIERFERAVTGMGLAALAHELHENYEAHGLTPVPGKNRFQESHDEAIEQENEVVAEIGLGERVCDRTSPHPSAPGEQVRTQDYTNEYVVMFLEDAFLKNAVRAGRRFVEQLVIDGYASGSAMAPGKGYKSMWTAQKLLREHPTAMAWVEGHADATGGADANDRLSFQRAKGVRDVLIAGTGMEPRNFNTKGRGTSDPVGDDGTPEGRAQNRRVVITIEEPDITL